jgi:hypothetical protein
LQPVISRVKQREGKKSMSKKLLATLFAALSVLDCWSSEIPSQYLNDRKHLSETFTAFNEANKLSQVPEGITNYTFPPGVEEKIDHLLQKGLQEGKAVSDEFLDWLHPEMKHHFRNQYMRGQQLYAQGRKERNVLMQAVGNELIGRWYKQFWEKNAEKIFSKAFPNR